MLSKSEDILVIGKIGAPYGVKGWVKINTYTDDAEGIFSYSPWQLQLGEQRRQVTVERWRHHNKALVAKLAGMESRDDAEAIKNFEICIGTEQLPELDSDEFYWRDLIGMQVVTDQGYNLGVVADLFETGSNDVLVVKANSNDAFGQKERLVPYQVEHVVKLVDTDNNRITVDWDPAF